MDAQKTREKTFFLGIQNSQELRVNLLQASRDIIKALDASQNIAKRREEKKRLVKKIKSDIAEIEKLLNKLQHLLPKEKIIIEQDLPVKKTKDLPVLNRPTKSKNEKTQKNLKKLEKQLYDLEEEVNKF